MTPLRRPCSRRRSVTVSGSLYWHGLYRDRHPERSSSSKPSQPTADLPFSSAFYSSPSPNVLTYLQSLFLDPAMTFFSFNPPLKVVPRTHQVPRTDCRSLYKVSGTPPHLSRQEPNFFRDLNLGSLSDRNPTPVTPCRHHPTERIQGKEECHATTTSLNQKKW